MAGERREESPTGWSGLAGWGRERRRGGFEFERMFVFLLVKGAGRWEDGGERMAWSWRMRLAGSRRKWRGGGGSKGGRDGLVPVGAAGMLGGRWALGRVGGGEVAGCAQTSMEVRCGGGGGKSENRRRGA